MPPVCNVLLLLLPLLPLFVSSRAHRPRLPSVVRQTAADGLLGTRSRDVVDKWVRREMTKTDGKCPRMITHRDIHVQGGAVTAVRSDNIVQDGVACTLLSDKEPNEDILAYYESRRYWPDLSPRKQAVTLPTTFSDTLNNFPLNKATLTDLFESQQRFLFGYQRRDRNCSTNVFRERSVSFVVVPVAPNISLSVFPEHSPLLTGRKAMIMLPRRLKLACLYTPFDAETDEDEDEDEDEEGDTTTSSSSEQAACFPGHATVNLKESPRLQTPLRNIGVSSVVHVGNEMFSRIFSFSHNHAHVLSRFVVLRVQSGHVLWASSGHVVYVNKQVRAMHEVHVGDWLLLGNGSWSKVVQRDWRWAKGLFNPHTHSGDLIVNGFKVSCYTESLQVSVAHAVLLPLRALFPFVKVDLLRPAFVDKLRDLRQSL